MTKKTKDTTPATADNTTTNTTPAKKTGVKELFGNDKVKEKFNEILGKNAASFITSVLQIVQSNEMLKDANPTSILNSALVAATLDLPINNSLGFAYIVPYNTKKPDGSFEVMAQFQLGYKGFIQLAQRSGQFQTISSTAVYEGQLTESDPLRGNVYNWNTKKSDMIVGYVAYFRLINGFEKSLFMSVDQLNKHGVRYSKTAAKGFGLWKTDFEAMANKTVLKLLLARFAPLSVKMQQAVIADQAVINDPETHDVTYADNEDVVIDKEKERVRLLIEDADDEESLTAIIDSMGDSLTIEHFEMIEQKRIVITSKK